MGGQILADVAAAYIFNAQARVDAIASADALRHRALHDPLTKLPNRTLMEDRLKLALAKSRRSGTRHRACCSSTSTASRRSTTPTGISWAIGS